MAAFLVIIPLIGMAYLVWMWFTNPSSEDNEPYRGNGEEERGPHGAYEDEPN